MKTLVTRIVVLMLCLLLPCAAMAVGTTRTNQVVHADFTLGAALHADGFPPVDAHLKAWESFLKRLTLTGSIDVADFFQQYGSRVYLDAALNIDGEETLPFTFDEYGVSRYLVSPMLRGDSTLFNMHTYFEFMLKPYYYLGLPTNYIALLTYPSATWYLAELYYAPVRDMLAAARQSALEAAGDAPDGELVYTVPFDRLLALCGGLNALVDDDTLYQHARRYLDALLAELYLSQAVLEGLSHTELLLYLLDPDRQGMTVTETEDGIVCAFGETVVFQKTAAGAATELLLELPTGQDSQIRLTYRCEALEGSAAVSAAVTLTEGQETLVSLSAQGEGLPVEGALGGAGSVTVGLGGLEAGDEALRQSLSFQWSRTGAELPYDLDLTVSLLHPQTGLPMVSVSLAAALTRTDRSVFIDQTYPQQNFFGLNPDLLEEFKERWGLTILAYLTPVVLEMPIGVMDDIVDFLLDSDILVSLTE